MNAKAEQSFGGLCFSFSFGLHLDLGATQAQSSPDHFACQSHVISYSKIL